jgi:hypothetical protein
MKRERERRVVWNTITNVHDKNKILFQKKIVGDRKGGGVEKVLFASCLWTTVA